MSTKQAKHLKYTKTKKNNFVLYLLILFFLLIMIISGIKLYNWYKDNSLSNQILDDLSSTITINNTKKDDNLNKYSIDFTKLKAQNQDTIGWLKVLETNIEYPVVKSKDNSYYLTHSFNNKENSAGWVFADYRNNIDGKDKNIIIYRS